MTRSCQVFPFTICNKSPVIFLYTRDIYIFYQKKKKLKPQWVTAFQAIGAFNKNSKFLNDCLTRVENMCLSKVAPFSCTLYVSRDGGVAWKPSRITPEPAQTSYCGSFGFGK